MFGRADTNTTVGLWPGLLRAGVAVSISRFAIGCKPVWAARLSVRRYVGMYVVLSSCRLSSSSASVVVLSFCRRASWCQHVQAVQTQPTQAACVHGVPRRQCSSRLDTVAPHVEAFGQRLVWHTTCSVRTRPSARLPGCMSARLHVCLPWSGVVCIVCIASDGLQPMTQPRLRCIDVRSRLHLGRRSGLQHGRACSTTSASLPNPAGLPLLLCQTRTAAVHVILCYIHAPVICIAFVNALKPKQLPVSSCCTPPPPEHINRHHRQPMLQPTHRAVSNTTLAIRPAAKIVKHPLIGSSERHFASNRPTSPSPRQAHFLH